MCFFFSLIPATFWLVIGFFVLFAATRTERRLSRFGRVPGIWTIIIAAFFPLCGAYVTFADICPLEGMIELMHTAPGD